MILVLTDDLTRFRIPGFSSYYSYDVVASDPRFHSGISSYILSMYSWFSSFSLAIRACSLLRSIFVTSLFYSFGNVSYQTSLIYPNTLDEELVAFGNFSFMVPVNADVLLFIFSLKDWPQAFLGSSCLFSLEASSFVSPVSSAGFSFYSWSNLASAKSCFASCYLVSCYNFSSYY